MLYGNNNSENKTIGKGCKRTPAWETIATKSEVSKKIEEFWDTRTEGNPSVWTTLKAACLEPSPATAEQIIRASGLSMLSGSLMLTFDEVGYRYDLPVYVINEANKYGSETPFVKLPGNYKGEDLNLVLRCSKFPDTKLMINSSETVSLLKKLFAEKKTVEADKLRLFYNGKELKNEMYLFHCGLKENIVVQVHISL